MEESKKEEKKSIKIAISASGEGLDSMVDMRFGRCPYYVIVEIEDKKIKNDTTIENPAMMHPGGAGIAAAQMIGDQGVEAVITGNMGPNAFNVLKQLNIKIYQASGKIRDVVQQFIEGKLTEVSAPTGPEFMGKPGMGRGQGMGQGMGRRFQR